MCEICVKWDKNKLSTKQALKQIGEKLTLDSTTSSEMEHYLELSEKIMDKELPLIEEGDTLNMEDLLQDEGVVCEK